MNTLPPRLRSRRWALGLVALIVACLVLVMVGGTPAGRAARNVADYRLRTFWWSLVGKPAFDPERTGSLVGQIDDVRGDPVSDAVALVATVQGQVFQARSDDHGRYRIDGIPPGRYVPLAGAWGFQAINGEPVQVVAGRQTSGLDFILPAYSPEPVVPAGLVIGPRYEASSQFPVPMVAARIPFTFTLDGLTIEGGQIYLPAQEVQPPLATVLIVFPSPPLNWSAASVALTRDGYAVLAVGPDGDRGFDLEGHARDFRAAFQLWQEGRFPALGEPADRWVAMSGSFGSLILFRALRDLEPAPPAIVDIGGVSDAFLGVQSLYSDREALAIPPPYDSAVAALGRPDRDPAFFFAYSPVFFAEHLPPTFVIHTYSDEVIPYNQSEALAAALEAAGVPHKLLLYEDTTHYLDAYRPTEATFKVYEEVMGFACSWLLEPCQSPQ